MSELQAIVYARYSSGEQARGDSITRQLRDCEAHCVAQGWEIETTLQDRGKSGFKGQHRLATGALGTLEREAVAGEHRGKVLVLESLDRLSREDHADTYDLIRLFTRAGVSIATVDGPRFYEAHSTIKFEEMIELVVKARMNHEASLMKSRHGRSKWAARRDRIAKGEVVTALCPAWLRVREDRSGFDVVGANTPNDRGALVRRIFEMADAGMGSLRIVRTLNQEGVPTWPRFVNREPKAWQRAFVVRLLTDPAVVGDMVPMMMGDSGKRIAAGDPVRGYYPRIVDPDLFQRVSGDASARKGVRGNRSPMLANLVSGLAVCSVCGSKMVYRRSRAAGYVRIRDGIEQAPTKSVSASLRCPQGEAGACENKSYLAYLSLERALIDSTLHLALDDKSFARHADVAKLDSLIADRERDHAIAYSRAEDLWEDAGASPIAKALAQRKEAEAAALTAKIVGLKKEREKAAGQVSAAEHFSRLALIRENLQHEDVEVRATYRAKVAQGFRSVIDRIVCHPSKAAGVHFLHGLRYLSIKPGRGRAAPTVWNFDLHKPGSSLDHLEPVERSAIERYLARTPRELLAATIS
jgi:DNA invertase Pin-like site-specific DNA recombinase